MNALLFVLAVVAVCRAGPPEIIWQREYPQGGRDLVRGIELDSTGGAVIWGTRDVANRSILFLLRTDARGEELWRREFSWLGTVGPSFVMFDSLDQIFVGGQVVSAERVCFTMRLAANGDTLNTDSWPAQPVTTVFGLYLAFAEHPALLVQRGISVRGENSTGESIDPYGMQGENEFWLRLEYGNWITAKTMVVGQSFPGGGMPDIDYSIVQCFRYDPRGFLGGECYFRCAHPTRITAIRPVRDDGYIMVGGIDPERLGFGTAAFYLVRLDSQLDTLWTRQYPAGDYSQLWGASDVVIRPNGNFLVIGTPMPVAPRGYSYRLLEVSAAGELVWEESFGDDETLIMHMKQARDGAILLAGIKQAERRGEGIVKLIKQNAEE